MATERYSIMSTRFVVMKAKLAVFKFKNNFYDCFVNSSKWRNNFYTLPLISAFLVCNRPISPEKSPFKWFSRPCVLWISSFMVAFTNSIQFFVISSNTFAPISSRLWLEKKTRKTWPPGWLLFWIYKPVVIEIRIVFGTNFWKNCNYFELMSFQISTTSWENSSST